jgi:hypothetical protein
MLNEIIIDGNIYKLESIWRKNKFDKSKDIKGNKYPYPKDKILQWTGKKQFIDRIFEIQDFLYLNKKTLSIHPDKCLDCLLCNEKCVVTTRYIVGQYIWDDGLTHYMDKHNIKPSEEFMDKIFDYHMEITEDDDKPIKLLGRTVVKNNVSYLKLDKNQIMIIDALMKHGGYNKKYYDTEKKNITRYSEHAGFFDIRGKNLYNIIISGNTLRVDRGDEEIFLPSNIPDAYYYEYIFHTHPPTPKPGGRANDGILYEFPSLGDIFHFIDHYNDGHTIGSLVMTPEGLYNIRKLNNDNSNIEINEDNFYAEMRKTFKNVQQKAISKYGVKFTTYTFYSKISQDMTYINIINEILEKYELHIDYYPRVKDFRGSWIVDTIYVQIFDK